MTVTRPIWGYDTQDAQLITLPIQPSRGLDYVTSSTPTGPAKRGQMPGEIGILHLPRTEIILSQSKPSYSQSCDLET